jgi:uncharacterized protein with gpF-like domain
MATHIVNTTLKAGERIGSVLAHAADTEEGVLAAVDSALDSAAGWVSDLAGRLAVTIGNWVVSDLAVHLGEQQPVTVTLTWNTVGDNAVRQDHVDADGQTVGAGDPFDVGGEELMFPGDPMGSDENTINCRCFLTTDDGSEYDPSAETENVSPFGD